MRNTQRYFYFFWSYCFLPISMMLIGYDIFWGDDSVKNQQIVFLIITSALFYGLHEKYVWAWYLSWPGILAAAAIPLKFGLVGGVVSGIYLVWAIHSWKSIKESFRASSTGNYAVWFIVVFVSVLVAGIYEIVDDKKQKPVHGAAMANMAKNQPQTSILNIRTWIWSPASSESVIDDVYLNSIEGKRYVKITNKSKYEITRVSLGIPSDDLCIDRKNHYQEFISCDVGLRSNSTQNAYCETELPSESPICLVGVNYLLPYSGSITPVGPP